MTANNQYDEGLGTGSLSDDSQPAQTAHPSTPEIKEKRKELKDASARSQRKDVPLISDEGLDVSVRPHQASDAISRASPQGHGRESQSWKSPKGCKDCETWKSGKSWKRGKSWKSCKIWKSWKSYKNCNSCKSCECWE